MEAPDLFAKAQLVAFSSISTKLIAMARRLLGDYQSEIADDLGVTQGAISIWEKIFLRDGVEGLFEKPRSGRPRLLSGEQEKEMLEYILAEGSSKTYIELSIWVKDKYGVSISVPSVCRFLKRNNISRLVPRPVHVKKSQSTKKNGKKTTPHS